VPYSIQYTNAAERHLRMLTARQRSIVLDAISLQLAYQPTVPTRNRKRMEENPLGPWALRVGDMRVYYEVEDEPEAVVTVLVVGVKQRNMLRAGDQIFDLTGSRGDEDDQP
jgi:mRNA-degrading endonuclease RelE of RelBE toxin-antitoxin system